MSEKEFEKLIDPTKYQVFLVYSRAGLPLTFFSVHPWFVVNMKGKVSRYDIRHVTNPEFDHLFVDPEPAFRGLSLVFPLTFLYQKTNLIYKTEGNENSLAYKLAEVISNSPKTYPNIHKYSFGGPNCGTYIRWVLDQFPEIEVRLPWINKIQERFT